ncbi:MAG: rRNA maturation RNase YbeY [Bacteroidota bacterium]
MSIACFTENIAFAPPPVVSLAAWLEEVVGEEEKELIQLNFIFCDDTYLHALNVEHLQHDTLTDVITFDYADKADHVEGDIYISVDTVHTNAKERDLPFGHEISRVIVHGVLHLMGYEDKTQASRAQMRVQEDRCLALPSAQAVIGWSYKR